MVVKSEKEMWLGKSERWLTMLDRWLAKSEKWSFKLETEMWLAKSGRCLAKLKMRVSVLCYLSGCDSGHLPKYPCPQKRKEF